MLSWGCFSVMSQKYNTEFFKQFTVVMNALDNLAARTHVNRMCLAANVPLIESGTGYIWIFHIYNFWNITLHFPIHYISQYKVGAAHLCPFWHLPPKIKQNIQNGHGQNKNICKLDLFSLAKQPKWAREEYKYFQIRYFFIIPLFAFHNFYTVLECGADSVCWLLMPQHFSGPYAGEDHLCNGGLCRRTDSRPLLLGTLHEAYQLSLFRVPCLKGRFTWLQLKWSLRRVESSWTGMALSV